MDTFLFYRLIEAVHDSLEAGGWTGFRLSRAAEPWWWTEGGRLAEYLKARGAREAPLLWNGRTLPGFDALGIRRESTRRRLILEDAYRLAVVDEDVAVAMFAIAAADSSECLESIVLVGERRAGALQAFADAFGAWSRERRRSERRIVVIGGPSAQRPTGPGWEELALSEALREDVRRQVDGFFDSGPLYRNLGLPHRRGLLFAGPPGNGKTSILRTVAASRSEPLFVLAAGAKVDDEKLDEAFDRAALDAPSILCFEDLDSFFGEKIALSHFLNRLDGLAPLEGVLILATSNHPEELDEALTDRPSRFDRVWTIGNPDEVQRRRWLSRHFGEAFDERLVAWTDGFSLAQVKEVWVSAALAAVREGRNRPSLEEARQAALRLRGQKGQVQRGFETGPSVGFASSRGGREDGEMK